MDITLKLTETGLFLIKIDYLFTVQVILMLNDILTNIDENTFFLKKCEKNSMGVCDVSVIISFKNPFKMLSNNS